MSQLFPTPMKRCVVLVVTLTAAILLSFSSTALANSGITISGTVRDYQGVPVAGVMISLIDLDTVYTVATGVTDPAGTFTIDLPAGTTTTSAVNYILTFIPPEDSGLRPTLAGPKVFDGSTTLDIVLLPIPKTAGGRLSGGASLALPKRAPTLSADKQTRAVNDSNLIMISGSIKNAYGEPFAGAEIQMIDPTTSEPIATTKSDSNGFYSIAIEPGTFEVQVIPTYGSGYGRVLVSARQFSSDTVLNFALVPAGNATLSGHVLDPTGQGIPGQRVCITPIYSNNWTCQTTDSQGAYMFQVPFGEYQILVSGDNSTTGSLVNAPSRYSLQSVFWSPNVRVTGSMVLDLPLPEHRVRVHVQDSAGNPVANALVSTGAFLTDIPLGPLPAFGWIGYSSAPTDADGNVDLWLFTSSPNEPYTIFADPPTGSSYITSFSLLSVTKDTVVTVTLNTPVTLTGRLLDPMGGGIPGQQICLSPGGSGQPTCQLTGPDGSYSFEIAPGEYKIQIWGNNAPPHPPVNAPYSYFLQNKYWEGSYLSLHESTVLDILLPEHAVHVHVQDAAGNPVPNVSVFTNDVLNTALTLAGLPATGSSSYSSYWAATTDSDGNATLWLFTSPVNKTYTIIADPPVGSGYGRTSIPGIDVLSERSITITLRTPVTVTGQLSNMTGNGVPGQLVCLAPADTYYYTCQTTDAQGMYSLQVTPGDYGVRVMGFSTDPSLGVPLSYEMFTTGVDSTVSVTQDTVLAITVPARRALIHVQEAMGPPVSNLTLGTASGGCNLTIGTLPACGYSFYSPWGPQTTTDTNGDATVWLFPTPPGEPATIIAQPSTNSTVAPFNVYDISVTSEQLIVIALTYIHSPPVTSINLSPPPDEQGVFRNPVTVTLSAVADQGYSVDAIYYRLDGEEIQTYTGPFVISEEGSHTIEYWAVDNAGVCEAPKAQAFQILLNRPPIASPGGPYVVSEGSSTHLDGTGSYDPDGDPLTFAWDLDDDHVYEVSGATPTFSAEFIDGPTNVTVRLKVCDDKGACDSAETTVTVLNVAPTVGPITTAVEAVKVNTELSVSAVLTDPASLDTHTATWEWGDGTTSAGNVVETAGTGSVTGTHVYTSAGIYTIRLTVTDDDGASGEAIFQYAVVYDPKAGFVTGGGWINSPPGACALETCSEEATGRAHFRFVVKYKRKSNVPKGVTKFRFKAGNLKFHMKRYEWLVITGTRAQFKGSGSINGKGDYGFMITVIDGRSREHRGTDKFRIKIWDKATGDIVYDNQWGAPDDADPTTAVKRGSIVIHKRKEKDKHE